MNNAQVHGCPLEGWVCFHCNEVFTTVGGAADHFGTTPDRTPACQIKLGDELGLVMELRRAEEEREQLRRELDEARRQLAKGGVTPGKVPSQRADDVVTEGGTDAAG